MRNVQKKSILFKVSILITVLCLIIMSYSAYSLHLGWSNYQQATDLSIVQDMIQNFSDGLKNFMFERGRMNVVLSKEQPISDANIAFINERRTAADEAFESGFSAMERVFPKETGQLREEYEKINLLRLKTNEEAEKPLSERDANTRELWFDRCTDYINTVITEINVIRQLSQNHSNISNYFDAVIYSLYFRSIVGNESSVITSAIARNSTLSAEVDATLLFLRGEEKQVWSELEKTIVLIDSQNLTAVLEDVRDLYYLRFRPEQERIIELARNNQLYEGADREIANLSVPVLDSILRLSDEAAKEIESANQQNIEKGLKGLISGMCQSFASILIIILIPIYFRRRFVQPLNDIIITLENISEGKVDSIIPYVQRADEIGKLACGADMLKNSIIEEQSLKKELEQTVLKLEELSIKDTLTGLYNRRYIKERFDELVKRYKRNTSVFSVIMCDIDNFKSFNDQYGHECGDKVLVHIAALLSGYCRESDVLARWGGEEFLLLLPDTNDEGAGYLAERIRVGLESSTCECDCFSLTMTMTFGIAEYSEEDDMQVTIRKADMALLQGKKNGRNQVVIS